MTSETPRAIASTAAIVVLKLNDFAFLAICLGVTSSWATLTEMRFNDFFNPSLSVVNKPVEPSWFWGFHLVVSSINTTSGWLRSCVLGVYPSSNAVI